MNPFDANARQSATNALAGSNRAVGYGDIGNQQPSPKQTIGSNLAYILDRLANCHAYTTQLENHIIGPSNDLASSQAPPNPTSLNACVEVINDRIAHLEMRLSALLERF